MSPNGVAEMFKRLAAGEEPRDARSLAGAKIAAIGPGTVRALAAHGIRADIVPERSVAESLAEALEEVPVEPCADRQGRRGARHRPGRPASPRRGGRHPGAL